MYSPRAASNPRLHDRMKPKFSGLRIKRIPEPKAKAANIVLSREQSSTIMISKGICAPCSAIDLTQL